ncbi:hypothetical protein MCEMRE182_00510 [Candidatus Nanopelagicaceae bacterium]
MNSVLVIWQQAFDDGAWSAKVSTAPEMPNYVRHQIIDREGNVLTDMLVGLYPDLKDNIDSWISMGLAFMDARNNS